MVFFHFLTVEVHCFWFLGQVCGCCSFVVGCGIRAATPFYRGLLPLCPMWQQCALSINRLLLHTSIFNPHILYLPMCMLSHAWHQEHGFALGADWFVLIFFLLICVCCDRSDVFTFNWYQLLENCCVDCTIWVDGEYWFFFLLLYSITLLFSPVLLWRKKLLQSWEEVLMFLSGVTRSWQRKKRKPYWPWTWRRYMYWNTMKWITSFPQKMIRPELIV